jgi:mannitol operon repressor
VTQRDDIKEYAEFRDEIWDKHPHYRGLLAALKEVTAETDRGVALVVTSFLDRLLGDSLAAFLIENDSALALLQGFNAPLGTLNTKIAACHALGLITDAEMRECHTLRRIRNAFAHEIEVTFDKGSVKDLCGNLTSRPVDKESPRSQFMRASLVLLINLLNRPHYLAQKRLTQGNWQNQKEKAPDIPPAS